MREIKVERMEEKVMNIKKIVFKLTVTSSACFAILLPTQAFAAEEKTVSGSYTMPVMSSNNPAHMETIVPDPPKKATKKTVKKNTSKKVVKKKAAPKSVKKCTTKKTKSNSAKKVVKKATKKHSNKVAVTNAKKSKK